MSEINCDFCTIRTESERIIRQTTLITSFLSIPRLALGHALVIPNRHIESPVLRTIDEIIAMEREADRLHSLMLGQIAMGVDRWQKTRPNTLEDNIKRNHIHTHVLPSKPGEVLYERAILWRPDEKRGDENLWKEPTAEEITEMLRLLRPKAN